MAPLPPPKASSLPESVRNRIRESRQKRRRTQAALNTDRLRELQFDLGAGISETPTPGSGSTPGQPRNTFRNVVDGIYPFPRPDCYQILISTSEQRLDLWICDFCLRLHRNTLDSDPGGSQPCCTARGFTSFDKQGFCTYQPAHVKLSLKYMRLADKMDQNHEKHRKTLMTPRRGRFVNDAGVRILVHIVPRVVAGRFLVYRQSKYRHEPGSRPVLQSQICRPCCNKHLLSLDENPIAFAKVDLDRLPRKDRQLRTKCPCCTTEISIVVSGALVRTRVWEDFGTEYSSTELISEAHSRTPPPPVSIQNLFESKMREPRRVYYIKWQLSAQSAFFGNTENTGESRVLCSKTAAPKSGTEDKVPGSAHGLHDDATWLPKRA